MQIGVPHELKDGERRVAMIPTGVAALVAAGHSVIVEHDAGECSGFPDREYRDAGARIALSSEDVWSRPLVVKVKELQRAEFRLLRARTTVFGFAQLNRDPALLEVARASGARFVAYETVRGADGGLPLLAPMSRIAGRLAPLVGAQALQCDGGGAGTLVTGVDEVPPARVLILGAGNVGREAARVAARLGCDVCVYSRGAARLESLASLLAGDGTLVRTLRGDAGLAAFAAAVGDADLVIGAVLEPGTLSPKLISRGLMRTMRRGSVLVDVGIDHGGIAETSRMTSISDPTYVDEGVVHYAVPNMPSLVARTATMALAAATLPYVLAMAQRGLPAAIDADPGLAAGVMVWDGAIVHPGLAGDAGERTSSAAWRSAGVLKGQGA